MDEYTEGYIGETNGEEREANANIGCAVLLLFGIWVLMLAAAPW